VIAEYESTVYFLQPFSGSVAGREPVIGRIVVAEVAGSGPGGEPYEPATAALHHLKDAVRGAVEVIARFKQDVEAGTVAGGADFNGAVGWSGLPNAGLRS